MTHPYRTAAYPIAIFAWVDPQDSKFIIRAEVFGKDERVKVRWLRAEFEERFVPLGDWHWYPTGGILGWELGPKPDGTYHAPTPILMWCPQIYGRPPEGRIFPKDSDARETL